MKYFLSLCAAFSLIGIMIFLDKSIEWFPAIGTGVMLGFFLGKLMERVDVHWKE